MVRMRERVISCLATGSLVAALLSTSPLLSGARRDKTETKERITEAEAFNLQRQLFDALTKNDNAAFKALLAEDVIFLHMDGRPETKAEFIAQTPDGVTRIFKPLDTQVHVHKGLAVLSGPVDVTETETGTDGMPHTRVRHIRTSDVWALGPEGWQLVLLQRTTLPEPKAK
jgi:ketosteroid isomerase-like protein